MNDSIFDVIYQSYKNNFEDGSSYGFYAKKFDFSSSEALRSQFRRTRRRKGLPSRKDLETTNIAEQGNPKTFTTAKILCLDIETSPLCVLSWGLFDQNINPEAVLNDWYLFSWSAKWLLDDEILSDALTSQESLDRDDFRIVKSIWKLVDEADIVITHNGDKFDNKRLNTRFLYHNLKSVSHYQSIDTLIVARNNFSFSSNRLDAINNFLGLPRKSETGFDLWKRAWFGDAEALKEMEVYNRNDVSILEDLYFRLRGYIKNHPNMNLWNEENVSVCPNCGSTELDWKGFYYTYTGKYKSFRCENCFATGRSRQLETDKEKRKTIVRN